MFTLFLVGGSFKLDIPSLLLFLLFWIAISFFGDMRKYGLNIATKRSVVSIIIAIWVLYVDTLDIALWANIIASILGALLVVIVAAFIGLLNTK